MLAELAVYVAATIASAEAAARDADEGGLADGGSFSIATAKTQASDFAHRIAAISHQSMGAMGFTTSISCITTHAKAVGLATRPRQRTFWGEKIGAACAKPGPQALWASLTASRYARPA